LYTKGDFVSIVLPEQCFRSWTSNTPQTPADMVKRETMGQRLRRARQEFGLSQAQLREKIANELGEDIGETTIREIERDRPPNPGIRTIELLARGVELPPLEVIALGLKVELQEAAGKAEREFNRGRFMRLWKLYQQAAARERKLVDEVLQMLSDRLGKKT
jgi:transcriptional regulator with XRE-family HTH domain